MKNAHIIHIVLWNKSMKKYTYLCNQSCGITEMKCTIDWKYVTCKNCLKSKGSKYEARK